MLLRCLIRSRETMHLGKTHRFKKIASDAWHVGAGSAIIDGVLWVMCGRRPHCKKNLTCSLRSGASHVSGLFARHHDRWP
jgi:hypothetical protein